jgi:hypothetical protein
MNSWRNVPFLKVGERNLSHRRKSQQLSNLNMLNSALVEGSNQRTTTGITAKQIPVEVMRPVAMKKKNLRVTTLSSDGETRV